MAKARPMKRNRKGPHFLKSSAEYTLGLTGDATSRLTNRVGEQRMFSVNHMLIDVICYVN